MSILQYIPEHIKQPFRNIAGIPHPYGLSLAEGKRLKAMQRYQDDSVRLFGKDFQFCDAASFLSSHEDIFIRKIYDFESDEESPVIIDAGANIGLSTLYFGRNQPGARIISIECDRHIADILKRNVETYKLENIDIRIGAAWRSNDKLHFSSDHADGGHIARDGEEIVQGIRIRDMLEAQEIDFLKIDIEGAETIVLEDCEDLLYRVKRIFVEYHSFVNQPQTLGTILALLERNGFRYYIDRTGVFSSRPLVERYSEMGYDLQLNIFAINDQYERS